MKYYNPIFMGVLMLLPLIGPFVAIFSIFTLGAMALGSQRKFTAMLILSCVMIVVAFIHLTLSNLGLTPFLMLALVAVPYLLTRFDATLVPARA